MIGGGWKTHTKEMKNPTVQLLIEIGLHELTKPTGILEGSTWTCTKVLSV